MPLPLQAKHTRPNGEQVVQVDVPTFFNREETARALALVYPEQSPIRGEREVRTGLSRAAQERVLSRPGVKRDAALVRAYEAIVDRHFSRLFKYDSSDRWVGAGDDRAAKARFDVTTQFNRVEAARALALHYEQVPSRVGGMTLDRGLHQAAAARVWTRRSEPDAEVVERFDVLLGEVGAWSRPLE